MIDSIRWHCLETGDTGLAAHSSICIGAIMLDISHIGQFYKLSRQVDVSVRPWPYLMELCWAAEVSLYPMVPDMSIRQGVETMLRGENVFIKGVAYRFKAFLQKKDGVSYAAIIDTLKHSIEFLEISGPGGAAELLDIHPNTLTFRIKKLGIRKHR